MYRSLDKETAGPERGSDPVRRLPVQQNRREKRTFLIDQRF